MCSHPAFTRAMTVALVSGVFFLSVPARADYTATIPADATMTGDTGGDTLTFTDNGGLLGHNRFTEGDAGFNSNFDFDTVTGGDQTLSSGDLVVNAGDGNDVVDAFASSLATSYTFSGEGGDDTLTGSSKGDVLDGGDGNDTLIGKSGSDTMLGGLGDDHIVGGLNNDAMFGQDGSDTFDWIPGDGNDLIEGGDGTDVLDFNGSLAVEHIDISPNVGRIQLFRDVAAVTMDLNDLEEIHLETFGGTDTVSAVPFTNTMLVIDAGDSTDDEDTLNYDCKGGEVLQVEGPIQVVGKQPLFHSNFETVILSNCVFKDFDGDGAVDVFDNCPSANNPDQVDGDTDALGDVCDDDPEGDGVAAGDNCPAVANADQLDTDEDGAGDVCDSDADGDGIENASDNCPLVSNADQADDDEDGIGNACEEPVAPPPDSDGTDDGDDETEDTGGCSLIRGSRRTS